MGAKEAPPGRRLAAVALVLAGVLFALPFAAASISDTVFAIEAVNGSGGGSFTATFNQGVWDPVARTYSWSLSGPVDLYGGGTRVATLLDAGLTIDAGATPEIDLSFDVVAARGHTTFNVDCALLSFPTILADEAAGQFLLGATVWDLSEPSDGVYVVKLPQHLGIFQAYYNGAAPDGSVFREGLGAVGIGPGGGMASGFEPYPSSGFAQFNDDVSSVSVHSAFLLTADDRVVGSAVYGVVPEPAALMLLAVGALLIRGRRGA